MNGQLIESVKQIKDLGIIISKDFKSTRHCIEIEKKCNRLLGFIKRRFEYKNKIIVKTLYQSLILPHLEYCISFWNPSLSMDIRRLERVQARATKLVPELRYLPYESRLIALDLKPLRLRRLKIDLIQTYKILHGVDNVDYNKYFTMNNNTITRGNGLKLTAKQFNADTLGKFFVYRVVNDWNRLPADIVNASSLPIFKNKINNMINNGKIGRAHG